VTLPTPDARMPRSVPRRPHMVSPHHSIPHAPLLSPYNTPPLTSARGNSPYSHAAHKADHEQALDFATHSWDLATGGLKTLTAKRALPLRFERRPAPQAPEAQSTSTSFLFVLVMLICALLMLLGGGMVLLVLLQT